MVRLNQTAKRLVTIRKTDGTLAIAVQGDINMQTPLTEKTNRLRELEKRIAVETNLETLTSLYLEYKQTERV
jgi:hypothetical protein